MSGRPVGRLGVVLALLAAAGCASAHHPPAPTTTTGTTEPALRGDNAATTSQLGPWHLVGHTSAFGPAADEGVATIGGQVRYTGDLTVSGALQAAGWDHVGDPDAAGSDLIEPFQSSVPGKGKLFVTVAPDGTTTDAVHPLVAGEESANSFVAVAPGGKWMVSGEYGTERRLLQFPVPGGATTDLPIAGNIELDHPVVDLQGCAFATATRLICDSDDTAAGDPVIQVDLTTPLAGHRVEGTVTQLGPAPRVSRCTGTWEPEGVDVDRATGVLRLEVVPPSPCSATVTIYQYRSS